MLHIALSQEAQRGWGIAAVILVGLVVLAYVVFFLSALVSILGSRQSGGMKLVWIVLAFCAPFLGPLLWFAIGRRQVRV